MTEKTIQISENDRSRLQLLLSALSSDSRTGKIASHLREEIDRARVVPVLPPETVGLDSTVDVLDLDSREVDRFTLTLPDRADAEQGRLSILAPLGTALLGYSTGDEFAWEMPGGVRRLRIQQVLQPVDASTVR
jgi:regulator of nucleoside diphosphate kinase